ncbi:hypothetical protein CsSME_00025073 [Camellia sinensis var. sinensis]
MEIIRNQKASSSTSQCSYQVFLSFISEDTHKAFIDHLYTALVQAGFCTFGDDDGIERGEDIKFELQKAIQGSRISIIVFSKHYASLSWCLYEIVMILKHRRISGHVVLLVFYHVDPSHVRNQMESFKEAFKKHEERFQAKEVGDRKNNWKKKMEEWRATLRDAVDIARMNLENG